MVASEACQPPTYRERGRRGRDQRSQQKVRHGIECWEDILTLPAPTRLVDPCSRGPVATPSALPSPCTQAPGSPWLPRTCSDLLFAPTCPIPMLGHVAQINPLVLLRWSLYRAARRGHGWEGVRRGNGGPAIDRAGRGPGPNAGLPAPLSLGKKDTYREEGNTVRPCPVFVPR